MDPLRQSLNPEERDSRVAVALGLLISVVLTGTLGFMSIEGWHFWDALFFTLITITTVGYGDQGISIAGQRFAAILILSGIGVASYTLALIVQAVIARSYTWRQRMQKRIDGLRDHTIVCGFGRMGRVICERLAAADIPLVVIDRDDESVEAAMKLGYFAVKGLASDDETLEEAGLSRAANLISALDSEADNIVATLTARATQPDLTIFARADGHASVRKLHRAGATRVTSPYESAGMEMADAILRPAVSDFIARTSLSGSDIALAEVRVAPGSALIGETLEQYGLQTATRVAFVTLERAGAPPQIPPSGRELFCDGDMLIVAGDPEQISAMRVSAAAGNPRRSLAA